jgi:hypothetical protein
MVASEMKQKNKLHSILGKDFASAYGMDSRLLGSTPPSASSKRNSQRKILS